VTTIDELVSQIETEIASQETREATARAEAESILSAVKASGSEYLSEAQDTRMEALFKDIEHAKAAQKRGAAKLSRAQAVKADEDRIDAQSRETHVTRACKRMPAYDAVMRVGAEQQVYRSPAEHGTALDRDNREPSFIEDLYNAQVKHDPAANARLEHHGRQVVDSQPAVAKQVRSARALFRDSHHRNTWLTPLRCSRARAGSRPICR
jgi:hypothetical protein